MKTIITIQHTQSIHHTNGMVGSWTDWDLSKQGIEQAERLGRRLKKELVGQCWRFTTPIFCGQSIQRKSLARIWG